MTQSLTLAIDTAAPRLQLALALRDGGTDTLVEDIAKGHAEIIFSRIETLLSRNGVGHADVQRIAVTTGPGSFTGLRIGLSAARGLGLARGLPVVGVPSLLAISLGAPEGGPVSVLLDARRDEAYFQAFSAPGVAVGPAQILPMAEARAAVLDGSSLIESAFVDIGKMALFAAGVEPGDYPPHASYVRDADAKPQDASRIPRRLP